VQPEALQVVQETITRCK